MGGRCPPLAKEYGSSSVTKVLPLGELKSPPRTRRIAGTGSAGITYALAMKISKVSAKARQGLLSHRHKPVV